MRDLNYDLKRLGQRNRDGRHVNALVKAWQDCISQSKSATDSRVSLPPIPFESCHRF